MSHPYKNQSTREALVRNPTARDNEGEQIRTTPGCPAWSGRPAEDTEVGLNLPVEGTEVGLNLSSSPPSCFINTEHHLDSIFLYLDLRSFVFELFF